MKQYAISFFLLFFFTLLPAPFFSEDTLPEQLPLFQEAVCSARSGKFRHTQELIGQYLAEDAGSIRITYHYIAVLARAGQLVETIKVYEALPEDSRPPYFSVQAAAACYCRRLQLDKAVAAYESYFSAHPETTAPEDDPLYRSISLNEFKLAPDIARKLWQTDKLMKPPAEKATVLPDTDAIEELYKQAHMLDEEQDYLASYLAYSRVLELSPGNRKVLNEKFHALICLGCCSLAAEQIAGSGENLYPEVTGRLMGDEAMVRIRWNEPDAALAILERNMSAIPERFDENLRTELMLRTRYDRILAMAQKSRMSEVIEEFTSVSNIPGLARTPAWVSVNAADAYSYFEKADKALEIYRNIEFDRSDPEYFRTKMMVYSMLVEIGKYRECGGILEETDKETPVEVIERGILQENWKKEEIAINRAWWLLYQERFTEADDYLRGLLARAPFNAHIRTAIAHMYLWRGWTHRALEEFEIIRAMVSEYPANDMGYCYALWEAGREDNSAAIASELKRQHPDDKDVNSLARFIKVQNMRTLTVKGGYGKESPGAEETSVETRLEQPAGRGIGTFGEVFWQGVSQEKLMNNVRRASLGLNWKTGKRLSLEGSVSGQADGRDPGISGSGSVMPTDYFSFSFSYNTYSTFVPLQARSRGITSDEMGGGIRYRHSEGFQAEGSALHLAMSDGNRQKSYNLKTEKLLHANAFLKSRLGMEAYSSANSRSDVDYFSPEEMLSVYIVPSAGFFMYRKYKRSLYSNFSAGAGRQWQKGFDPQNVWFLRYEQQYIPADVFSVTLGTGYSLNNYDGKDTGVWNFFGSVSNRF